MRKNKLAVGILAVAALALLAFASSASATKWKTGKSEWFTGSPATTLALGTTKNVTVAKKSAVLTLTGEIASKMTTLQATGVTCAGTCVIENVEVGGVVEAKATGELKFTGITLLEPEPATCSTPTENTTKALVATVGMREGETGNTKKGPVQFLPKEGETFTTVSITGETCSIKGTYKVTGAAYGDSENNTGTSAVTQGLVFSEALQNELGASPNPTLKFGANPAYLIGEVNNTLSPSLTFQAHE